MIRTPLVAGAMLVAVVGASPTMGQTPGSCWDATLGPWAPIEGTHAVDQPVPDPPDESGDSITYAFPPRIVLSDLPPRMGSSGDARRVVVPEGALSTPKPQLAWQTNGDSLWITTHDGFSGTRSGLARGPSGWAGTLRTFSDILGVQRWERPLRLAEVDCDTPPPVLASEDVPAPRSVPSASGPPLRLAEPIPEEYETRPVRVFRMIPGFEPADAWAGADSVLVMLNSDGLIEQIELRYPEGFDAGVLEAELIGRYGTGHFSPEIDFPAWHNRSTHAALQIGTFTRVLMIDPRMRY